jgi:hypothetical protein
MQMQNPFVPGTLQSMYDDQPSLLSGSAPQVSTTHGTKNPGRYYFLLRTPGNTKMVSLSPSKPVMSLTLPCTPTEAPGVNHPNVFGGNAAYFVDTTGLTCPGNSYAYSYYWVYDDSLDPLALAQPTVGQIAITFLNEALASVTASVNVTFLPDTATAVIDVTIDHSPTVTGVGSISPWGSTAIAAKNATLASSGTARVGGGNWQTQTSGDDLVGVGLQLASGWKFTSTTIKSAVSAATPTDLSPDNTWRGASISAAPSSSDMRTTVHWHYSGIDSLDYTIEWQISGPLGARPLAGMTKIGTCDN